MAARVEVDRHLPRWLETFRTVEHQKNARHGRFRWREGCNRGSGRIAETDSRIGRRDRDAAEPTGSANPSPYAGHTHVIDAPVRDRGPRRLHHDWIVRRRPAGRTLHHHGEGRQHDWRANGHRRDADIDWLAIPRAAGKA